MKDYSYTLGEILTMPHFYLILSYLSSCEKCKIHSINIEAYNLDQFYNYNRCNNKHLMIQPHDSITQYKPFTADCDVCVICIMTSYVVK